MTKLHGMDSIKASRIKRRGNRKEHLYATLIRGKVIPGVKKADVEDLNGKFHSIKGGSEMKGGDGVKGKWQIFLYKLLRFEDDKLFGGRDIFIKILKCYPNSYNDYESNKDSVKDQVKIYMTELFIYLSDYNNRYDFINKSFFDERVDYFVVYHNDVFRVFDRKEMINLLVNLLTISLNNTSQKVTFKYNNKIVSEIEVRTTNDGKYPAMLFNTLKHKVCGIVEDMNLIHKRVHENIYAYGSAIDYMTNYMVGLK
jgi:hypothetical protein